jgi:type II secretory pathway pseudopilin PulG
MRASGSGYFLGKVSAMLCHWRLSRSGLTLMELLLVTALIAVLIGLIVPAVQKVHEAAARTQCQNNMKQMGLAVHAYATTYGWIVPVHDEPMYQGGWLAHILPYLGQDALYQGITASPYGQGNANPNNPDDHGGMDQVPYCNTIVPTYHCPADPRSGADFIHQATSTTTLGGNAPHALTD